MTLQSIAFAVCDLCGWTRPTQVAGSTETLGRQLFAHANNELDDLSSERDWPELLTYYTFPTVAAQADYNLPADFDKLIGRSLMNASSYYRLYGGMTVSDFMARSVDPMMAITPYGFRIKQTGTQFVLTLTPTPSTVETLALFYKSSNYVTTGPKPLYTDDNDVAKCDESLIKLGLLWRIRRAKGFDYSEEYNAAQLARSQRYAQKMAFGMVDLAGACPNDPPITDGYVRQTGYGV